uniref:CTP_transf_like domain-containing protein n=1 Tax=Macrostomum lignano TaxID=282301 RepID=A0A1I8IN25_9PLAT
LKLFIIIAFALHGVHADLFVVLLQGGQVLAGLTELALLHALADVPVHEGALGVHQVELVVQAGPGLGDGGGVAQHAYGTLHLGEVAAGHNSRRLVVDADLEAGRAPVHELDILLGLDGGDGGVDVLGDDVASVQHAAGHVLAVAWVALHHLVGRFKTGAGYLGHRQLLVIDVQGAVKAQRGGDGGHDLADQAVQVGVGRALDVQVAPADVVDGLVVHHEGAVGVLQGGVGGQDGVVGLHHGGGNLRGRIDGELQLGLLAIVNGQALHQQGGEAGAGAAAEGVNEHSPRHMLTRTGLREKGVERVVTAADGLVGWHLTVGLDAVLQAALPIWTPAWPTWTEMHSRCDASLAKAESPTRRAEQQVGERAPPCMQGTEACNWQHLLAVNGHVGRRAKNLLGRDSHSSTTCYFASENDDELLYCDLRLRDPLYRPPKKQQKRYFRTLRDPTTEMFTGAVSDGYNKPGLLPSKHRIEMLKLALGRGGCSDGIPSSWIRLGTWEAVRSQWTPTRKVLDHYQRRIDAMLADTDEAQLNGPPDGKRSRIDEESDELAWLRSLVAKLRAKESQPDVRIMLLCGGDVLQSFAVKGVWQEEDMVSIVARLRHGGAVSARLRSAQRNIRLVTEWAVNDISSTLIRRTLQRNESVRYMLPDPVIDYIYRNGLYGSTASWPRHFQIVTLQKAWPAVPPSSIQVVATPVNSTLQSAAGLAAERSQRRHGRRHRFYGPAEAVFLPLARPFASLPDSRHCGRPFLPLILAFEKPAAGSSNTSMPTLFGRLNVRVLQLRQLLSLTAAPPRVRPDRRLAPLAEKRLAAASLPALPGRALSSSWLHLVLGRSWRACSLCALDCWLSGRTVAPPKPWAARTSRVVLFLCACSCLASGSCCNPRGRPGTVPTVAAARGRRCNLSAVSAVFPLVRILCRS